MLNRWIEEGLLDELEEQGMGCIVFTALAQGLLTDRYLDGVPEDSRAARGGRSRSPRATSTRRRCATCAGSTRSPRAAARSSPSSRCSGCCATRGSPPRSSAPRSVEQLDTNLDALAGPPLTEEELEAIDAHAVESGVNLWAGVDGGLSPRATESAAGSGHPTLLSRAESGMISQGDQSGHGHQVRLRLQPRATRTRRTCSAARAPTSPR